MACVVESRQITSSFSAYDPNVRIPLVVFQQWTYPLLNVRALCESCEGLGGISAGMLWLSPVWIT